MRDCLTCEFANRDNHGRYIDMCSGSGNCAYEKYSGEIKDTLDEYMEKLLVKYTYEHPTYSSDYITGVRDALSFIQWWNKTE